MSGNLTWLRDNGEWGIDGVDLAALPPKVYGALAKLMRLEHPICDVSELDTSEEAGTVGG